MFGVAFHFGRMPLVALHEHRQAEAGERKRGCEKQRPARDDILGLAHVRDDFLGRLLRAGGNAGERQRRAHQFQELAAPLRVVPLGRLLGKLAMEILAKLRRVGELPEAPPVQTALVPARRERIAAKSISQLLTSYQFRAAIDRGQPARLQTGNRSSHRGTSSSS